MLNLISRNQTIIAIVLCVLLTGCATNITKPSPLYTFFLLNDDMELNRNRQFLV